MALDADRKLLRAKLFLTFLHLFSDLHDVGSRACGDDHTDGTLAVIFHKIALRGLVAAFDNQPEQDCLSKDDGVSFCKMAAYGHAPTPL